MLASVSFFKVIAFWPLTTNVTHDIIIVESVTLTGGCQKWSWSSLLGTKNKFKV